MLATGGVKLGLSARLTVELTPGHRPHHPAPTDHWDGFSFERFEVLMSGDGPSTPNPQYSVSQERLEELFRRLSLRPGFGAPLIQQLRQLGAEGMLRTPTRLANCLRVDQSDMP